MCRELLVDRKKHAPAKLLNLLSFPVRLINEKVRAADPDSEAASFTQRYLDLADKALHRASEDLAATAPPLPVSAAPPPSGSLRLRLESHDGSPAQDYRIHADEVEVRLVRPVANEPQEWRRLAPQELAEHVRNNTVVAQWLQTKMGWRKLLKKCTQGPEDKISPAA